MDTTHFQYIAEQLMAWRSTPKLRSKIAEALEMAYGIGYDAGRDAERDTLQRKFEDSQYGR